MLICSVFTSFIAYLLNSYYSAELVGYSTIQQIKDICPSFFTSLLVSACIWTLTFLNIPFFFILTLQLIGGGFIYLLIYEKLRLEEYMEIRHLFLSFIRHKK